METLFQTQDSAEFQQLYDLQVREEYQKTLQHAATLKRRAVRFVTVDFAGGIPQLKEIHESGGGREQDLLTISPSNVISKLGDLGLTEMSRVIRRVPESLPADPTNFTRSLTVPIDDVAAQALVTLEFHPAIEDFAKHVSLKVHVDGTETEFSLQNDDPDRMLAFDGRGNVATATLRLDTIPRSGQITFEYESPDSSLAVPACTVYTYLRLDEKLRGEFRPEFAAADTRAPYAVSPNQPARWIFALRRADLPKPDAVKSAEAVLREVRTGSELRLDIQPDPQAPGIYKTDEIQIPSGLYDVQLHITLPSGARFRLRLRRHILSQDVEEILTIDFPLATGDNRDAVSFDRGHIDFGEIGDETTRRSIPVTLRTLGIKYPVTVLPQMHLADAQGNVPNTPWITFSRTRITLQPGRGETIRLRLSLPERIAEAITDGRFEGQLSFLRIDTNQPLILKRLRQITGVSDDDPADLISFTLRRPRLTFTAPRCFRDSVQTHSNGTTVLPINVAIGQAFTRQVVVEARHDSVLTRSITLTPTSVFYDSTGRQVPSIRIIPLESTPLTQEVAPGACGRWAFQFILDENCQVPEAASSFDMSAPGLVPQHVVLKVRRRDPQLGSTVRSVFWIVAAIAGCLAIRAAFHWARSGRFRTGQRHLITTEKPLKGALAIATTPRGDVQLVPQRKMTMHYQGDRRDQVVVPQRGVPIDAARIGPHRPLTIQLDPDQGVDGRCLEVHECLITPGESPELDVEVASGGQFDSQTRGAGRRVRRRLALVAGCIVLAATLNTPCVLRAAQWVYDLFTFL